MQIIARHKLILNYVNQNGSASVNELADLADVSLVTIRNDLAILHKKKFLQRIHGAAIALDGNTIGVRIQQCYEMKRAIAEYASSLIEDGDTIFLGGGSTIALLTDHLKQKSDITIITTSHQVADLIKPYNHTVIVMGGVLQRESESVVGPLTLSNIKQIPFQKAFLGIDGWHPQMGFTGKDMLRSDITSAIMEKGVDTIALADSSKFGQIFPYPLLITASFRHLITDSGLSPKHRQYLAERGTQISIVKGEEKELSGQ